MCFSASMTQRVTEGLHFRLTIMIRWSTYIYTIIRKKTKHLVKYNDICHVRSWWILTLSPHAILNANHCIKYKPYAKTREQLFEENAWYSWYLTKVPYNLADQCQEHLFFPLSKVLRNHKNLKRHINNVAITLQRNDFWSNAKSLATVKSQHIFSKM